MKTLYFLFAAVAALAAGANNENVADLIAQVRSSGDTVIKTNNCASLTEYLNQIGAYGVPVHTGTLTTEDLAAYTDGVLVPGSRAIKIKFAAPRMTPSTYTVTAAGVLFNVTFNAIGNP